MRQKKFGRVGMLVFFLKGSALIFAASIVANLFATLFTTLVPQIISVTVDSVIGSEPVSAGYVGFIEAVGGINNLKNNIWIIAVIIGVLALLIALFRYLETFLTAKANQTLLQRMRNTAFYHIQRLPLSWHTAHMTGDIIQRCTSDTDTVTNFISNQLITLFRILIMTVFSLVMMFMMNYKLALIAAAFIPVLLTYSLLFYRRAGRYFKQCDEQEGVLSTYAQENFSGVRVVRAFGKERYERDKFEKQNVYYTGLWVKVERFLAVYWTISDFLIALQLMVIVIMGTFFCINGALTLGRLLGFISYNTMLMAPIRQLGRIVSNLSKAGISLDRISEIMNSEEETYGEVTELSGDIVFNDVSFSYDENPVLENINLKIPQGTTLGIIGPTGSGKSTLVALLDRLYEVSSGNITLGGKDIREIPKAALRKNIGLVLQEGHLFSRSIRENLTIACEEKTEEQIRHSAETACVDKNIDGFADGYDTMLGERGVRLSGGQIQRIAIARTLLRDTPYVIFDDSLSAVDSETDIAIRSNLEKEFIGSTIIIISHRVTTVMDADNIIVLEDGKIAEHGNHETLIKKNGLYKRIYDIQMALPDELKGETL